ncbi:MAG: class II fumarate hydratase, partial [Arcobacteraceae bacterium]
MDYRIEKDTMGEVKVSSSAYWGAQTQRSLENFKIGIEKMPNELILGFVYLKYACACSNESLKLLETKKANAIKEV